MELVPRDHVIFTCWCPINEVQRLFSVSTETLTSSNDEDNPNLDLACIRQSRDIFKLEVDQHYFYKYVASIHGIILFEKVMTHCKPEERHLLLLNPGLGGTKSIPKFTKFLGIVRNLQYFGHCVEPWK